MLLLVSIILLLIIRNVLIFYWYTKAVTAWYVRSKTYIISLSLGRKPDIDIGDSHMSFFKRFKQLPSYSKMFFLISCWSYKSLVGLYESDLDVLLVTLTYKNVDNSKLPPLPDELKHLAS